MARLTHWSVRCSFSRVSFVAGAFLIAASSATAQGGAIVSGLVTDTAGVPVLSAVVSVAGTDLVTATDYRGAFQLRGLAPGSYEVRARRLGFTPSARTVQITAGQSPERVNFALSALPTTVKAVIVEASQVEYSGRLAGYYERLHRRSGGQFISREEIGRQESRSLSQLLSRFPGLNSVSFRTGENAVRMRGMSCRPLVWLDGVAMPAAEVDLNSFPLSTLHGIEIYLGSTTAPFDYTMSQNRSECGTILLWSRGRDTEAPPPVTASLLNLEDMAGSRSVFTADKVDIQAELLSPKPLQVAYPASLFASGFAGIAVAEFVVGEDGSIEPGTFSIVSTSHPLFAQAVSRALHGATYSPARIKGAVVRQVVQQRFEFSPSGRAAKVSALSGR